MAELKEMDECDGNLQRDSEEVRHDNIEEIEVAGQSEQVSDEWIDILESGSLKKKILKEGIVETRPSRGDTVRISFKSYVQDGVEVEENEDFIFTLGDGEVINGLELIVPLMDKGETAEVFMASRFAYGSQGLPPDIPPDADLTCFITLIDYKPEDDPTAVSIVERRTVGNRKRERGNWWYNRGEYMQAVQCYKAAVNFLDDTSDTLGEEIIDDMRVMLEERLKAFNNMAAAQMKLEAYDVALKSLENVLMCQPENIKALFRKGKILGIKGQTKEGVALLRKALALDPSSRVIHQELARLQDKARLDAKSEKSLYRQMLGLNMEASTEEKPRYQAVNFPWKTWLTLFIIIFGILMGYHYYGILVA